MKFMRKRGKGLVSICGCVFFPEIFQKPYIYSDISVTSIVMVSMANIYEYAIS